MNSTELSFATAGGDTTAYVARPDNDTTKAVIVVQEYWGLNDHIKDIANRYANEGFIAIAPDLYRGQIAKTPDEASKIMQALPIDDGIETIKNAMDKARGEFGL